MNRILIGPAPLKEIEPAFGPHLRAAGFEMVFPNKPEQMTADELMQVLPGCVAAVAGSEPYTRAVLEVAAAKGLLAVCRAGVGYDGVDVGAATDLGIAVGFAPGTNENAVAEHAVMLMLALARNLVPQHALTVAGKWPRRMVRPLRGTTVGIIGLGRTGKAVAVRAKAFGVDLVACDPYAGADFAEVQGIPLVSADEVFQRSDFLTLHCPLTPETRGLVNARTLGLMKPTAFLVNTSRGPVVDEPALVEALKSNRIAGAALDVFIDEPLPANHPFCTLPNAVLTAHTAGVDTQSLWDMARVAAATAAALAGGGWPAECVVNPAVRAAFEKRRGAK